MQHKPSSIHKPQNGAHNRKAFKTFKATLFDLDGTIFNSYRMFLALAAAEQELLKRDASLAQQWRQEISHSPESPNTALDVQALLHLREMAEHKLRSVTSDEEVLRVLRMEQQHAFRAVKGFLRFLDILEEAGSFIGIYTATPDVFAAIRLSRSDVSADRFHAIFARKEGLDVVKTLPVSARDIAAIKNIQARIIPYDFKKPSSEPMRLLNKAGIAPEEILFVGEGKNDLLCAHDDQGSPKAVFAFQEQGAVDICATTQAWNELIRPGAEPLGLDAVAREITKRGLDNQVIRLNNGFETIIDHHDNEHFKFGAPDVMPVVVNGKLTVPRKPSRGMFERFMRPSGYDEA